MRGREEEGGWEGGREGKLGSPLYSLRKDVVTYAGDIFLWLGGGSLMEPPKRLDPLLRVAAGRNATQHVNAMSVHSIDGQLGTRLRIQQYVHILARPL